MNDAAPPPLMENGKPVDLHYSKRFCPELSKATLAIPESNIVGPDGQKKGGPHLEGCRGMACMWFLPEPNEKGEIVGGNCAMTVQAGTQNSTTQLLAALVNMFNQKIKVAKLKI